MNRGNGICSLSPDEETPDGQIYSQSCPIFSKLKLCSFKVDNEEPVRIGLLSRDSEVADLTSIADPNYSSLNSLLQFAGKTGEDLEIVISSKVRDAVSLPKFRLEEVKLQIPFTPVEVWGAGVTYMRSKDAREVETSLKGLYTQVYGAVRPEIFFKTTGLRCVGPEGPVTIRSDSKWSVPEPELTLVLGENCSIVGYTIGNDMSARDIEGENPLYLPQAKIFKNCCSLGPYVVTKDEIPDPKNLKIQMKILRMGEPVFEGSISTSSLKRSIPELLEYLARDNVIPAGCAFMTGTGLVPPDDFSLKDGDIIEIDCEKIGLLRNVARQL